MSNWLYEAKEFVALSLKDGGLKIIEKGTLAHYLRRALEHIHQLEAERDKERAYARKLLDENYDYHLRVNALEAGLGQYGNHPDSCMLVTRCTMDCCKEREVKCTCGLTDLIGKGNG